MQLAYETVRLQQTVRFQQTDYNFASELEKKKQVSEKM